MGSSPWWYVVPLAGGVDASLSALREREFKAGRYNPVIRFPAFPVSAASSSPGPGHATMKEARMAAGESGTRSILDVDRIANAIACHAVAPLDEHSLRAAFGSSRPTREMVEKSLAESDSVFARIDRGEAVYVLIYEHGLPAEILFAGWSFD